MDTRRVADLIRSLTIVCVLLGSNASDATDAGMPRVVVVAQNVGTETTDFLVPYGVLSRAGVLIEAVAVEAGRVLLHPGDLALEIEQSLAGFDATHPEGADVVIVPAVMDPTDPTLRAWLIAQANRGALMMSICDGAWVLAHAGLLDGQRATAHWYSRDDLADDFPSVSWVRNERYVEAQNRITTTGVSASIPASLALVERLVGPDRAHEIARELGVGDFGPLHDSEAFHLSARFLATAAWNGMRFWKHELVGLEVSDGVDEISLALSADALARTWMSQPRVLSSAPSVTTQGGLRLETPRVEVDRIQALPSPGVSPMDAALQSIEDHYGRGSADWVSLQLEYSRR